MKAGFCEGRRVGRPAGRGKAEGRSLSKAREAMLDMLDDAEKPGRPPVR